MVKSKKKKEKTADFNKVKFKVGKHKPRGGNVTDTSFRTATINISAQLEVRNVPTNKRNLSLKDLLNQVNHYNATIRHEAMLGMLDLFQSHPKVMHEQLSVWIPKVFERLSDTDSVVRHSLFICVKYAMNIFEENEIVPFYKIMIAYICCGMTHINEGVQLDSLNILDILLTKFPEAFIPFWKKVLTNFMDLISKQSSKQTSASQSVRGTKVKTKGREMNTVVGGKLSSVKGREQILEKLYKMLKVMLTYQQSLLKKNEKCDCIDETVCVSETVETNIRICKYTIKIPEIAYTDFESWLENNDGGERIGAKSKEFDNIYHLVAIVLPVLINCWVEYDPGQLVSGFIDSNSLSSLLPGMKATIDTLDALLNLLWLSTHERDRDDFIKSNIGTFREFYVHFVQLFFLPMQNSRSMTNNHSSSDPLKQFYIEFNFVIARIICNLLLSSQCVLDIKQQEKCINKLGLFITDALQLKINGNDFVSQLIILVESVFLLKTKQSKSPEKNQPDKEAFDILIILKEMINIFSRVQFDSSWKIALLQFFSRIMHKEKDDQFLEKNKCDYILVSFVDLVVDNLCMLPSGLAYCNLVQECVKFIKDFFIIGNINEKTRVFTIEALTKFTEPNGGLFVHASSVTQMTAIELVYGLFEVPLNLLKNLTSLCNDNRISIVLKKYIISVLSLCIKKKSPSIRIEEYISFIISVVTGYSFLQLQSINVSSHLSWCTLTILEDEPKEPLLDFAIDQLKQIDGYMNLYSVLIIPIERLLLTLQSIPLSTAKGLIKLLLNLSSWQSDFGDSKNQEEPVNDQVANLVSSVLLYSLSDTFKSEIARSNKFDKDFQLLSESISLLRINKSLCCHIIKKWIQIIKDNKTNLKCVESIIEVLLSLLEESKLRDAMRDLKTDFVSVDRFYYEVPALLKPTKLLQLLAMHVSLL
ncbi:testis-expressed protein 10 homolog isoform X1 [Hydra vulgaris]|nr:testis-expressed protein 10 homolog [Hydra vulgaris]